MGEVKPDSFGECPLCLDAFELDDINFYPCPCEYQVCRFCWHRIKNDENGLCPACRSPYLEAPALYKPLTKEQLSTMRTEKKHRASERKVKVAENRKHLASVRVVQKCLVFVVGLSPRLTDGDLLKKTEYFGKFGRIHKCVVNINTNYAGSTGHSASAYITFYRSDDALHCVQQVNNMVLDGRTLKASLGTTKYCSQFLKAQTCNKPDCMYLHELGEERASFTKEDMQQGKHQEYEQHLHDELFRKEASDNVSETTSERYKTVFTLRTEASSHSGATKLDDNRDDHPENDPTKNSSCHSSVPNTVSGNELSLSQSPGLASDRDATALASNCSIASPSGSSSPPTEIPSSQENRFCTDHPRKEEFSNQLAFEDCYGDPAHRLLNGRYENGFILDDRFPDNDPLTRIPGYDRLLHSDQSFKIKEDDLEFDPFKECQKGLEELMQSEMTQARHTSCADPFNIAFQNSNGSHGSNFYINQSFNSMRDRPLHQPNLDRKELQDGLRALLPNVNISFQSQSRSSDYSQSPWNLPNWSQHNQNSLTDDPAIISSRRTDGFSAPGYWENNNFLADGISYGAMKHSYQNAQLVNWNSEVFTHNAPPPGFQTDMN